MGQRDCKACLWCVAQECRFKRLPGSPDQKTAAASFHDWIIGSLALGFGAKSCHNRSRQGVGDGPGPARGQQKRLRKTRVSTTTAIAVCTSEGCGTAAAHRGLD